MECTQARAYLASLYFGLAGRALQSDLPFDELSKEFSTGGGLNVQVVDILRRLDVFTAYDEAFDQVQERIRLATHKT